MRWKQRRLLLLPRRRLVLVLFLPLLFLLLFLVLVLLQRPQIYLGCRKRFEQRSMPITAGAVAAVAPVAAESR